jgi:hypothetical protein
LKTLQKTQEETTIQPTTSSTTLISHTEAIKHNAGLENRQKFGVKNVAMSHSVKEITSVTLILTNSSPSKKLNKKWTQLKNSIRNGAGNSTTNSPSKKKLF